MNTGTAILTGRRRRPRAFSLVELVMVVTILGIMAAIAVPRISHAARGASAKALQATVSAVRRAIDAYYAEHGRFPGYQPGTNSPDGAYFVRQLTEYSDERGDTQAGYGFPYLYGPYLRTPFPKNPFNGLSTVHVKSVPSDPDPADGSVGWVAVLANGDFGISAAGADLERIGVLDSDRDQIETK